MTPASALTVPVLPVDPALSRRLKRAATTLARSRAERDKLIREAHAEGASLREIAALVGMSHVGVRRIIFPNRSPTGEHRRPADEQ